MDKHVLRLFITGRTPRTESAIATLREIFEKTLEGHYELQVIDILENPQLAEDEKIFATPTLIKLLPQPPRRIIGDLSNKERVLFGLDLHSYSPEGEQ